MHRSKNFKNHFMYLNKGDNKSKELYKIIVNLPFEKNIIKLNDNIEKILENELIIKDKEYFEDQLKFKELWAKSYISKYFTAGICTTQRAESIYTTLSKVLSNSCSLLEMLEYYRTKYINPPQNSEGGEKEFSIKKSESKNLENLKLFDYFRSKTTNYIIEKIKIEFQLSLNYKIIDEKAYLSW